MDVNSEQNNDATGEASVDETPPSLEELQKTKSWLKNQLLEHQAAAQVHAEAEKESTEDEDPEITLERIVQLQKELQELSGMNSIKDLMLERAQIGDTLVSALFPPRAPGEKGSGDAQSQEPDKELVTLLEQQKEVSTDILQHHSAIQEMQPRLDQLRKENLALKTANRELMANLVALKEEQRTHSALTQHNQNIARAQEKKEELVCKLEVMRGVFRRLIIGSGVDWGSDPALTKSLLDLGTPLDELFTEPS